MWNWLNWRTNEYNIIDYLYNGLKMKKIIKTTNWILAGCLSLLGFVSCEKEKEMRVEDGLSNGGDAHVEEGVPNGGDARVEYGTPYAIFTVKGTVVGKATEKPIAGIQVTVPRVDHHQRPTSGFIPDQRIISHEVRDTLYTKENGDFLYQYDGFPTNDSINIILQFKDITETNRYKTGSTKVTFFSSELKNGDGRLYSGSVTKDVSIRLDE